VAEGLDAEAVVGTAAAASGREDRAFRDFLGSGASREGRGRLSWRSCLATCRRSSREVNSVPVNRLALTSGVRVVVKLRVRSGESIQDAVRRFRKLCERSGLRKEMRRKAYYEKPSERRRREELKRLRKARQAARV